MAKRIIQNEIQCHSCGEIIYSAHVHDFKWCECGAVGVDGGLEYLRRSGNLHDVVERSMLIDEDALAACMQAISWADDTGRNTHGKVLAIIRALRQHDLLDMDKFGE